MALDEISLDGRTVLHVLIRAGITVAIHRSDILEPIVRPFAGVIGDAFILIQDNARAQRVLVSMTFLDVEGISVMNWLTMSPYLNPIEHTWAIVLDRFDNGRIIHRMHRTLSMPWFRNCSPCHKRASGLCQVAARSVGTIGEAI